MKSVAAPVRSFQFRCGKARRNLVGSGWTSIFLTILVFNGSFTFAQMPSTDKPAAPKSITDSLPPVDLKSLPRNIFNDQKDLVLAPFHMNAREWTWTVPLAFVGAGLLASDTAIEKRAPSTPSTVSHAKTASDAGVAALAGIGGAMFLWGHFTDNDQQRETGLLAGEAGVDAVLDTEALKYITGRERPFTGDNRGRFFQGGSSFPSEHASVSFAIASVIAHEYPGPATQILAYGTAGAVSAARLIGHQHFATDLLVGSALGWYLGRQVYNSHSHYTAADIARFGTFRKSEDESVDETSGMGSPYVPLDSWIYPAMERLIATGYIDSADLGLRPWTRMECARLLSEQAGPRLEADELASYSETTYKALAAEFQDETGRLDGVSNYGFNVDEIYTRVTGISGTPLRDGLHFGQTIINDYGRPYAEGINNVTGFTTRAVAGPVSFFMRAEYQHAPTGATISSAAADNIAAVDGLPAPPTTAVASTDRMNLLEGYVGVQLSNWQFTFGKQALWWGADQSGPMLFSNNAAPILMLKVDRVQPFKLPSALGVLGEIRVNYLVGRLSGHRWVFGGVPGALTGSWSSTLSDQPFILGEKISLKPTPNLEVGFSVTALFGGPGVPATLHKLLQAGFSNGNGNPGTSGDPGDRRGGFDFAYRMPRLNGLTFYGDAFTDDEATPWVAWNKTALTSGLHLPQVPGLPKLDLRVEGVFTDIPEGGATVERGFYYINSRFKSGYTNDGNLIGSWIGREGQGAIGWATYQFNPKSQMQFNFRHQKVSQQFISGGGTLTDFGVSAGYQVHSDLNLSGWVQRESWIFPIIQPNRSNNVTASLEVRYEPHKWSWRTHGGADKP